VAKSATTAAVPTPLDTYWHYVVMTPFGKQRWTLYFTLSNHSMINLINAVLRMCILSVPFIGSKLS